MSLLMDALKKAEREKQRAAENNSEDSVSPVEQEKTDPLEKTHTPLKTVSDQDENWAFETGELELEPIPETSTPEILTTNDKIPDLDDTTVREPVPELPEEVVSSTYDDLTIKTDSNLHRSDFDHDATLPSERAIQTSLKDYFEASQSITMDESAIDAAIAPDVTEHSVTSTSPLDLSSTHVTAHTIFTAGNSRKASTGLGKYALLGTLFLTLGLGAVALYYSYITPTSINVPPTLPTVATMVDSPEQPQTVEVDVNTVAEMDPPFEPGTTPAELVDPILTAVVQEVTTPSAEKTEKEQQLSSNDQNNNTAPVVAETVYISPEPVITRTVPPIQTTKTPVLKETSTPSYALIEHDVVTFSQPDSSFESTTNLNTTMNERMVVSSDQSPPIASTYSVLEGNHTQEYQTTISNQPIEVMSAEDFAEGLTMPKSAIKITRGQVRRPGNSDLTTGYRAYLSGDYLNAKAAYRKVLSRRPDNRDALLGIAAVAVMEGNYETAYRYYQHLLQQNPQDQIAKAALFNLQGNAGGNVNESQLKLSLDQNPDSPQVHFSLGSFYAKQARWPEAQQSFFDAFNADQKNADYAYNLAVSLDHMSQAKAALNYYRSALKLAGQTPVNFNTSQVLARIQKLSGIVKN
ncbi:MAG: tetratricopeptide repeat protein [Gammaproteobacteria bacterium]